MVPHNGWSPRQVCLLSPTLFNIFLERIMTEALQDHQGTVFIGGRIVTNLRFADDIDGLAGTEKELRELADNLNDASKRYGMEISAEKTKTMSNEQNPLSQPIRINGKDLGSVTQFKYLGSIIKEEGSTTEIRARIAQASSALKKIWKDQAITLKHKIRLLRALVFTIFLYACETWTLNKDHQKKISAFEMRSYRAILGINYQDRVRNEDIRKTITDHIGVHEDLLTTVRKRKMRWYGHVTRSKGLSKTILQGKVEGRRKRGRQKKRWTDNIEEWTGKSLKDLQVMAHERDAWRELVDLSSTWRPHDA